MGSIFTSSRVTEGGMYTFGKLLSFVFEDLHFE